VLPDDEDDVGTQATANDQDDDEDGDVDEDGEVEDEQEGESDEGEPPSGDNYFREAGETCAAIAVEVDRLWLLPAAEQAAAIEPLLIRASELGLGLCAMQHYPLQSVRLLRLALRCRSALSAETWEAAWTSAAWLDFNHPELPELLVEVARAGARSLVTALLLAISDARWKAVARIPGAVTRIAEVIDNGPSYASRCIAAVWISCMGGRAAVPALRRALRAPHFVLRYHAIDVLDQRFPDRILPEDVIFLLDDAVIHAPPDDLRDEEMERANVYLPRALERAVVRLKPAKAIPPLVDILEGRCASRWRLGSSLHDAWALGVLAAAFPEEALAHIDRRLCHAQRDRREIATDALERLPDELARPRLIMAAADGVPEIAERAQAIWLERYAELCPREPMAGVETALLDGPPSEQMRSRLETLRTGPLEARAAMVEVLLGEAPDPEALVLLLFAAIDSRIWERRIRPGLPEYRETFCRTLVERFGTRAVDGIVALEARFPEGRFGWLHALSELLSRGGLPESTYPALRATAARRIDGTDETPQYDAIAILAHVVPPPELADRLWRMACNPAEASFLRYISVRALAVVPAGDGRLDAAVRAEMDAAMAAGDLPRFALAAAVGFGRKLPEASALTERALAERGDAPPEDTRVISALADCVEALGAAGHLSDTFLLEALGRPGTYRCAVAARLAQRRKLKDSELEALGVVFRGPDPACAAEAACALLGHSTIGPESPELLPVAARAPEPLRAELLFRMRIRGAPLRELWPMIEPLLVSPNPEVTEPFQNLSYDFEKEGMGQEMRALLPRVVDEDLRMEIEDLVSRDGDTYWQDQADQDDDA
jgi:hypothetical protein